MIDWFPAAYRVLQKRTARPGQREALICAEANAAIAAMRDEPPEIKGWLTGLGLTS